MTQPPLVIPATVEVPQAEKTTLSNGATLYTLASDDFEVLRITFVFRAGSAVQRVPFSASAAANMLAEGTRDMTAQQIAEQLDYYGSYFDVNIDRDYAYISFCTLSKFFGQTLAVAEQVLLHPTFPEEELRTLAQAAVERYVSEELGGLEHETARFRYLFRRLLKSVYAVVDNVAEELRASRFQPISFELGFGAGKDLPPVELSVDGMTVSISGFVDRVDGWEHDGRLYLRVVDYKTGRKTFDLTDIWNGMGLQMLLYLFTLEREGEALYNREIIPAGVLYLPARDAVVAGSRAMSEAERRRKVDAELRRRGIVLDEPEVLAAMEEPGDFL